MIKRILVNISNLSVKKKAHASASREKDYGSLTNTGPIRMIVKEIIYNTLYKNRAGP
jgi:hypothetical protein